MAIIGFNFTKISAEKAVGSVTGKVDINNNITIIDVKEIDVDFGTKDSKGLLIKFDYVCKYEPKIGLIKLEADLVDVEDKEVVKKSMESWTKSKIIDKSIMHKAMAYVLSKCTVEAIVISRDVGLPAPVPLPKINEAAAAKVSEKPKQVEK